MGSRPYVIEAYNNRFDDNADAWALTTKDLPEFAGTFIKAYLSMGENGTDDFYENGQRYLDIIKYESLLAIRLAKHFEEGGDCVNVDEILSWEWPA